MKVSIVIPAHNEETSLGPTLEAVLKSNYPDFEVIVVNNASTDKTALIASNFPVTLVHESRKGLLWAREKGRQTATGEIIANIDADCLPDPEWLNQVLPYFHNASIVAVSGPYDYYDADPFFRYGSLGFQKYIYPLFNKTFQSSLFKKGATLIGGNNFIRANILRKAGGYNTSILFYGEDTDTAKRVSAHGRVIFSPKVIMKTSARRFKAEGKLNLMSKYWYHFFKQIFSKK
ncbi:MAG: glycosyltransferase family 2 protein [Candidatus Paceibacterota bacterium]